MKVFVVVLIFLGLVVAQTTVFSKCVDTFGGQLCLVMDTDTQGCSEFTGSVTLDGDYIFGPTTVPVFDLLSQIQNQKNDPNAGDLMCYHLAHSDLSVYGTCSLCATIDELEISGNSIHYCGSGQFNCSSLIAPPVNQPFTIPCFDVENCGFFTCRNDCNNRGTCTSLGICECDAGYYGYDCSIQINDMCASGPLFDSVCWTVTSNCDSVDLLMSEQYTYSLRYESVKDFTQFDIVPCQTVINEDNLKCDMCLTMDNIQPENTGFKGCPTISMSCNSVPARKESLECIHIPATSNCDTTTTPDKSTSNYSNQIMFGLGVILVLLVILALGFLMIKKLKLFPNSTATQTLYIEDEEPLEINNDY
jgi:hypothetical protein